MRPANQPARDRLDAVLNRLSPASVTALAEALGISAATARRLLDERGAHIVAAGAARRRRYALRRSLRDDARPLPIYAIDREGRATQIAELALLRSGGSHCDLGHTGWPLPADNRDGWWDGLPWPLADLRPQGFMGRQFARLHGPRLDLDPNPERWSDDDVLVALSRAGGDQSGNLVVGEAALRAWQTAPDPEPIAADAIGPAYAALAEQALLAGTAGSSAAGEFPKFTARRALDGARTPQVIVKFSGADDSPAVRRWRDLLICEHHAGEALAESGFDAARSRIVMHGGRCFLESERFDRHGARGRSPLVSLGTLDAAFVGSGGNWRDVARRLCALGVIRESELRRVTVLWWFGRLIGNTDMHGGNLSFGFDSGRLELAPVYDMLPMAWAPLRAGEVTWPALETVAPLPGEETAWERAREAVRRFAKRVGGDGRVSGGMREVVGQMGS